MQSHKTLYWITTVFGIIISIIVIYAAVMSVIWAVQEGSGPFLNDIASSIFWIDLKNSTLLYLIYLIGYAIAWRNSLWGSTIIIAVSILGYLFGYKDERIAYVFTFFVGFLYLVYWIDGRRIKEVSQ